MSSASDEEIARYAANEGLCILTADLGFADVRRYPPSEYQGIVVLRLPRHATASFIRQLLESFIVQIDTLPELRGNLAIVESGRVRFRSR